MTPKELFEMLQKLPSKVSLMVHAPDPSENIEFIPTVDGETLDDAPTLFQMQPDGTFDEQLYTGGSGTISAIDAVICAVGLGEPTKAEIERVCKALSDNGLKIFSTGSDIPCCDSFVVEQILEPCES